MFSFKWIKINFKLNSKNKKEILNINYVLQNIKYYHMKNRDNVNMIIYSIIFDIIFCLWENENENENENY